MRVLSICFATTCLAAGVLSGCGGTAQSGGLSASTAGTLRGQLATVASDAARGDRAGALSALATVSGEISQDSSQLTSSQRTALQTGISRVRSRIMATVPARAATATSTTTQAATTTTPTTPTATAPAAPAPAPPPPAPHGKGPKKHPPPKPHDHHGPPPGHDHGGGGGD